MSLRLKLRSMVVFASAFGLNAFAANDAKREIKIRGCSVDYSLLGKTSASSGGSTFSSGIGMGAEVDGFSGGRLMKPLNNMDQMKAMEQGDFPPKKYFHGQIRLAENAPLFLEVDVLVHFDSYVVVKTKALRIDKKNVRKVVAHSEAGIKFNGVPDYEGAPEGQSVIVKLFNPQISDAIENSEGIPKHIDFSKVPVSQEGQFSKATVKCFFD